MRDINRIDTFCDELKSIWKEVPDWRFMQLINNFQRSINSDGFYIEDDKLIDELKNFLNR